MTVLSHYWKTGNRFIVPHILNRDVWPYYILEFQSTIETMGRTDVVND